MKLAKRVADLPVHPGIKEIVAREIPELYDVQREALEHTLDDKSLVLAIPTASGKSLVAYITILNKAIHGSKALYIVPLRALAQEKHDDLKQFEPLGIKVGMSIRDYDSKDTWLNRLDILVATAEKADALIRQGSEFMRNVDVVVADEVHLMNDSHRGPTVEVLLSWFKKRKVQILALSATVANSEEIARWLEADHVKSEWRPVTLKRGTFHGGEMKLHTLVAPSSPATDNAGQTRLDFVAASSLPSSEPETEVRKLRKRGTPVATLVMDSLDGGGQCLVFVNTRKSAETQALDLTKVVPSVLTLDERKRLAELSRRMVDREEPTQQCHRLAEAVAGGVAFHHAGLVDFQRRAVEQAFKEKLLKVLCATTTLAAGINTPARRVVVRDVTRFDAEEGRSTMIPVMEIQQMCGRAGRPQYDRVGEAVLVARSEDQVEQLEENFIFAPPEEIESKLATDRALRIHLLASISIEREIRPESLAGFINSTFYAFQRRDVARLEADGGTDKKKGKKKKRQRGDQLPSPYLMGKLEEKNYRLGGGDGRVEDFVARDKPKAITSPPDVASRGSPGATAAASAGADGDRVPATAQEIADAILAVTDNLSATVIRNQVKRVLEFLTGGGPAGRPFVECSGGLLHITRLGQLTSDLYLDPLSVKRMLSHLPAATETTPPVAFLHLVSCATEMPGMYVRPDERDELVGIADASGLLIPPPLEVSNDEYVKSWSATRYAVRDLEAEEEFYLAALRNGLMLNAWADESSEENIVNRFLIGPGDIRSRGDIAEWLLYSLTRLAPEVNPKARRPLERLLVRVKYGVREELIDLVSLPGIGRVRARELHARGFAGLKEIGAASEADLAEIRGIGPATAKKIKEAALKQFRGG